MFVSVYICVYVSVHINVCVYEYIYVCVYEYIYVCVYLFMHAYIYVCVCSHIYIDIYVNVYVFILVCVCVFTLIKATTGLINILHISRAKTKELRHHYYRFLNYIQRFSEKPIVTDINGWWSGLAISLDSGKSPTKKLRKF